MRQCVGKLYASLTSSDSSMTFGSVEAKLLRLMCQCVCVIGTKMSFEQRANIKFYFKIGKTFTETFELMKKVYGDDCLCRARVHEWFTRFRDGREDINDNEHTGRPKSVITENSIEIVSEFIKNEPKSSLKFILKHLEGHSGQGPETLFRKAFGPRKTVYRGRRGLF